MGNDCAAATGSRIAVDIKGVGPRDLSSSSLGDDVTGALALAVNIGLKGLGVSGKFCETTGVTADRLGSP